MSEPSKVMDPIPLGDRFVPIIELSSTETVFKGQPFTNCKKQNVTYNYDISVCKAAKLVASIIKILCF